jgi:hypothetical protein
MIMIIRSLVILAFGLMSALVPATGFAQGESISADQGEIRSMMDRFNAGFAERDADALLSLFQRPDAPFARNRPSMPDRRSANDEAQRYIGFITGAADVLLMQLSDPEITIAETTATLVAAYTLTRNGDELHGGTQVWSLLNTASGWRIGAVLWTEITPGSEPVLATASDDAAIREIVAQFERAFIEKDEALFLSLFQRGDAPFLSTQPTDPISPVFNLDGYLEIAGIVDAPHSTEERFHDVQVEIHDNVAIMRSPYEFLMAGEVSNYGYETWTLIRTRAGWKIISVVWSTTFTNSM